MLEKNEVENLVSYLKNTIKKELNKKNYEMFLMNVYLNFKSHIEIPILKVYNKHILYGRKK